MGKIRKNINVEFDMRLLEIFTKLDRLARKQKRYRVNRFAIDRYVKVHVQTLVY